MTTQADELVQVLSLGQGGDDRAFLRAAFQRLDCTEGKWKLVTSRDLGSALASLRSSRMPIVVCDGDPSSEDWKEILSRLGEFARPPAVIVASRLGDDRLWAEALNLGAYDVLAKPFDGNEVARVLSLAWQHWKEQNPQSS